MDMDTIVREELRAHLQGGNAHMTFDEAVAEAVLVARDRASDSKAGTAVWAAHLLEKIDLHAPDLVSRFARNLPDPHAHETWGDALP